MLSSAEVEKVRSHEVVATLNRTYRFLILRSQFDRIECKAYRRLLMAETMFYVFVTCNDYLALENGTHVLSHGEVNY